MMYGLDLFSGIGGMSLALREWVRPIAYCEIDPYCQGVLFSRMVDDLIPVAPIWDDIRSLGVEDLPTGIEILYGGFPCQNISCAGNGKGLDGERSGLFFEVVRLAKKIKPKFLFLENVAGITCNGGLRVVREIASLGYDCRWCIISAASVGAPHKRDRWFFMAHSNEQCLFKGRETNRKKQDKPPLPDTPSFWRESEPQMVGVDDGLSKRMDSIKALGNAVVPQQAEKAFRLLMYGE